jgi:hypothetical protein
MPPHADSLQELERWLTAFYEKLNPQKVANVPKLAKKTLEDQKGTSGDAI